MTGGDDDGTIDNSSSPNLLAKTNSSENFKIKPNLPSSSNDDQEKPLSLAGGRYFASTPNLITRDLPLLIPLAPIINRIGRRPQNLMPQFSGNQTTKENWGVTGTDEKSLSAFLDNFKNE